MTSLNKITLRGNLGCEPKLHMKEDGATFATFDLATHTTWTNKQGEKKQDTQWHKIIVFNDHVAGFIAKHLRKGSYAQVEGELRYRTWTDNKNQKHRVPEIVVSGFLGNVFPINTTFTQVGDVAHAALTGTSANSNEVA